MIIVPSVLKNWTVFLVVLVLGQSMCSSRAAIASDSRAVSAAVCSVKRASDSSLFMIPELLVLGGFLWPSTIPGTQVVTG